MRDIGVVKSYAGALLEAALLEKGGVTSVQNDLDFLSTLWQEVRDVYILFINSFADVEAKLRLWESTLEVIAQYGYQMHEITLRFMNLLILHQRVRLFVLIRDKLRKLVLAKEGITEVQVSTACELPPEKQAVITEDLAKVLKSKVQVQFNIDNKNIAGMVITIGDLVIDMSLRNTLRQLRSFMLI